MESVYHIVTIRVNETSWAHICRLRSYYLRTGYDKSTKKGKDTRAHRSLRLLPELERMLDSTLDS
jgi:hypothetical protein